MAPKSDKEIIYFLANIGKPPLDGDPDYVEKAKEIMKLITEKKIFLRPNDELGIMLAGKAKSVIGEKSTMLLQSSEVPSWEMVEKVLALEETEHHFEDWPRALEEVLEELRKLPKVTRLILILLFDCDSTYPGIDSVDSTGIANELKELGVQLLWIGSKLLKDTPCGKLNKSEKILMEILQMANGEYMTVEKTLPSLRIFKQHKVRVSGWKCVFQMANLQIPTVTYIQALDDEKPPVFQTIDTTIEDGVERKIVTKPERDFVDKHREAHPPSQTIAAYIYGKKPIPVPEVDEKGMVGEPTVQSFELYGFVSQDSIKLEDISSDTSRIVLPDGPEATKPFYCLVQAMIDSELVAIVRKVYRANAEPKMGVLFPHTDVPGEPWCLVLLELLYAEDRRVIQCPSLRSTIKELTRKQQDAVGDLIDSMMLTDADCKGEELFVPGTIPSPGMQHLWNSLSHRALNPDAPIPPMDEKLQKLLDPPEWIKAKSEAVLEKLRELFPIKNAEDPTTESQDTTTQPQVPVPIEIKKMECKIENSADESISQPKDQNVTLDDLFDADVDF